MMTQSGCFGASATNNDTIDNVAEVSATVDGIMDEVGASSETAYVSFMLGQQIASMSQRLRLLTWAIVALAAYVLIKELTAKQ